MNAIKAEQIATAVFSNLAAITSVDLIVRGNFLPFEIADNAGLTVSMGSDTPETELANAMITWALVIQVESFVITPVDHETAINAIRHDVYTAMMRDPTQNLDFVIDTLPGVAEQPVFNAESQQPTVTQSMEFTIRYRSDRNTLN